MPAMMDAQCPKCGRRIGWCGRAVDRPACSRCGHRPPLIELQAMDDEMGQLERLLATRPCDHVCRQQRVAAGLTLRQAAVRLGITARELSDYEWGRQPLPEELAGRMGELYDCGDN